MKRRSRKYWENRQKEIIDNAMDKKVALSAKELSRIYAKSLIYLNSKAKGIFDKYSSRFGLSELQARKLLNMSDSDLQRMLLMIQNSGDVNVMELRKILETPAYRTRIRRLEEQLKLIDDYMNKMQVEELNIHKSNYTSIANDTYYQAMYNIQKGVGYRFSFTGISEDTIDHILNTNWSGKSYSARIWENTDTLASKVKEELIVGLLTGRTEREMSQIISNQFQVGYSKARRLISTESCYVYNGAIMESYKESGIDEYVFMAVHDNKTSKICRKLDRKVFKVSEKVVGVNCPPMHPWCRSVTGPKVDDDIEFKRRAYNPQTGDYDVVSEKESYDEWKEKNKHNLIERKNNNDIIISGGVSGARNPFGKKAEEHAERYYKLVRSMKTDVGKIAQTTGMSESEIQLIKNYIFLEKHDLGGGELEYFEPDYMMAQSWQRLIDGKAEKHDLTLLKHEIMEKRLMEEGFSQVEAHAKTSKKYDYSKEASEYYVKIKKYKKD